MVLHGHGGEPTWEGGGDNVSRLLTGRGRLTRLFQFHPR